jgi:hypothetical protein
MLAKASLPALNLTAESKTARGSHLKGWYQDTESGIETMMGDADMTLLDQFAKGLELLDDYDHEKLDPKGITTRQVMYTVLTERR